ncbi:hypothetical protein J3Q64DRAFT_1771212 [Phycomyces blakesleeanus]|uniref:Uncharacterized protein n=1 Tax=Phycomyces blakesleeanus TaxID=4837 RepID=A0ABR3AJY3_PHYBL
MKLFCHQALFINRASSSKVLNLIFVLIITIGDKSRVLSQTGPETVMTDKCRQQSYFVAINLTGGFNQDAIDIIQQYL